MIAANAAGFEVGVYFSSTDLVHVPSRLDSNNEDPPPSRGPIRSKVSQQAIHAERGKFPTSSAHRVAS
jgi:hypothetical protein